MNILFIHQNFPGQFRSLAPAFSAAGHRVQALSMRHESRLAGVPNRCYRPDRGNTPGIHPWLINTESAVLRGKQVAWEVQRLQSEGFRPDVVLGHTGWGEMLCLRETLPQTRLVGLNEMYYRASGADVGFDPEFPADEAAAARLAVRNMHLGASLLACDVAITPTQWQADTFPVTLRDRILVLHEGIHTDKLCPDPEAFVQIGQHKLCVGDEVITFVNRNLEPMRGYHQFMRALPDILRRRPLARVVVVGGNEVSYGAKPTEGTGYKDLYLNEVRNALDMDRIHFVGRVPYQSLVKLLQVSACHVYLTVPFVLSWSMLEAMSLGALVVGSDTAPVREVITHGHNGLLVDFFSPSQLANTVCEVLRAPDQFQILRKNARSTIVERYDFNSCCLPRYQKLIETQGDEYPTSTCHAPDSFSATCNNTYNQIQ